MFPTWEVHIFLRFPEPGSCVVGYSASPSSKNWIQQASDILIIWPSWHLWAYRVCHCRKTKWLREGKWEREPQSKRKQIRIAINEHCTMFQVKVRNYMRTWELQESSGYSLLFPWNPLWYLEVHFRRALWLNGNISGNEYNRDDAIISSDFNEILLHTLW